MNSICHKCIDGLFCCDHDLWLLDNINEIADVGNIQFYIESFEKILVVSSILSLHCTDLLVCDTTDVVRVNVKNLNIYIYYIKKYKCLFGSAVHYNSLVSRVFSTYYCMCWFER